MIAALDWGGSWADAILWGPDSDDPASGLKDAFSVPSRQTSAEALLAGLFEKNPHARKAVKAVAVSGGDRRRVGPELSGFHVRVVDELDAIAAGARRLVGLQEAVAVSCGTGTAVVYYLEDAGVMQTLHLGGTAVGGGTLDGLSHLLLSRPVEDLEALARSSTAASGLDLTVGDIVGGGIGLVPPDATASYFAKAAQRAEGGTALDVEPSDVAKSLLHTVAETIATVASLAADKTGCNELVFCGRVAQNGVIQERIRFACQIHGKRPHFPKDGQYATAIGAAIQSQNLPPI